MLTEMTVILEVADLEKNFQLGSFFSKGQILHAVNKVSFTVSQGETLCIVGESGCGKTTLGRLILRLVEPTSASYIRFMGQDILQCGKKELRKLRRQLQIIFQDPISALNPTKTISSILAQPLLIHKTVEKEHVADEVTKILTEVGLVPPEDFLERHTFDLSGGQRQRVAIARALILRPRFVVCDEIVSFLDVSVRGLILRFMKDIQEKYGIAYLFITHDLALPRSFADRVMIMYLGKVVEMATTNLLYENPLHPYTKALLAATPSPNPRKPMFTRQFAIGGEVPSPINLSPGCQFYSRCPIRQPQCNEIEPELIKTSENHLAACHNINATY